MFLQRVFQSAAISKRTRVFIQDSTTFLGKTGLAFNTAGLTANYSNGASDTAHALALITNTVGGAWASGGFVEIDAAKMPGWYQIDIPDAVGTVNKTEAQVTFVKADILDAGLDITLTAFDPNALDKSGFALSSISLLAIWSQLLTSMVDTGTIGKLLADNIALIEAQALAIKAKTDALTLTSGAVTVAPHGLDNVIGYHPAGDA